MMAPWGRDGFVFTFAIAEASMKDVLDCIIGMVVAFFFFFLQAIQSKTYFEIYSNSFVFHSVRRPIM